MGGLSAAHGGLQCNGSVFAIGAKPANNWRHSLDRVDKENMVASLHETFEDNSMVVVTHYAGLTVKEMGDLRSRMRQADRKSVV